MPRPKKPSCAMKKHPTQPTNAGVRFPSNAARRGDEIEHLPAQRCKVTQGVDEVFYCLEFPNGWKKMGVEPKIWGKPPNHPFVHRVWNHYFHHPLWNTPIFGHIQIKGLLSSLKKWRTASIRFRRCNDAGIF